MTRWLIYAFGGLVVLVVGVLAVGWLLPVGHSASASQVVDGDRDRVFRAIAEFSRYPEWRTDVRRVEVSGPEGVGQMVREDGANGEIPYRVEAFDPPGRLVMRITGDLPFGGTWTYVLTPDGEDRTRVTITEDGEVYNPLFRVMARFVFGYTGTMETYLRDLARRFGG
ncbi:MAG: SRPBCC family protein [Vicinamibacterales bacterium]